jgi:hypothetical protein
MKRELLSNWWRLDTTDAESPTLRWGATAVWIFFAAVLISQVETGQIARGIGSVGWLMMISSYLVGPQCWKIIEAADGSNSRKALTILVLLGLMLNVSTVLAIYAFR